MFSVPANGVAAAEAIEETDVPSAVVAVTVNVYAVLLLNPLIVQDGVTGVPLFEVQVAPPDDAVAV